MAVVSLSPAARSQMLVPGILTVLFTILGIGVASLVIGAIPVTPGDLQWRFMNAVQLLGAGPQIAFLLMMVSLTALSDERYRVLRLAAILTAVFAVILLVLIFFFAFDFLQLRHLQQLSKVGPFTREYLRLGATSGVLGVAMLWAARAGFRASVGGSRSERDFGAGLVVGQ
jgi:hypothetical protein